MSRTISITTAVVALAAGSLVLIAQRDGGRGGMLSTATSPQVSDVRVAHRDGQTFITWKEVLSPVLDEEPSLESVLRARKDLAGRVSYRIYRSPSPIASVSGLTPVGTAAPLSAWNADFYGIDPPPQAKALRYAITDGGAPLAGDAGVYVHNPRAGGQAYYAVTAVVGGRESAHVDSSNSTPTPTAERAGLGAPVLQRVLKPADFYYVTNPELRYYTRWESPPNANRENQPIDYLVGIPPTSVTPAPVGIHLHAYGGSLNRDYGWWYNADRGAILVASNQIPYDWWTGYHELSGRQPLETAGDWAKGVVRPYTQTRLLSFVDWLATTRQIDRTRIFAAGNSMGGSGAAMLTIRHPAIAWAVSWVGVHRPHLSPTFVRSYQGSYGPAASGVRFEDGSLVWEHFDDAVYLRKHPEREIGFITFSNGKNDNDIGWPQAVDFLRALQETRQPHLFVWGQQGHGQRAAMPAGGDERTMTLDIRNNQSLPAFTRSTLDDNPGNGSQSDGAQAGQVNRFLEWEPGTIVDSGDRWEITIRVSAEAPAKEGTVDVTPRRLQQFRPAAGEAVRWSSSAGRRVVQSGEVVADRRGLVTVPAVQVRAGGGRLVLERASPASAVAAQ